MDNTAFDFGFSLPLINTPLFNNILRTKDTDAFKDIELTYLRARAIARTYGRLQLKCTDRT
jgi:hypothetical protein